MPYKRFLGYRKGPDGQPEIVEEEASIVRLIYKLFLYGKTPYAIAKYLNGEGIPTPGGKSVWRTAVVESILTNEKYRGSALLQKKFTTDFLTKKQKINEGEVPQYYVEVSHPAIVEPALFDLVQHEHAKMKAKGRPMSGVHCFSGRVFCGQCGGMYGSKVWNSGTKYRRVVWQCNEKRKDSTTCDAPHVTEEQLRRAFVIAFNAAIVCKHEILTEYRHVTEALTDSSAFEQEVIALQEECDVVLEMMRKLVQENANVAQDQEAYRERYAALNAWYEDTNARLHDTKNRVLEQAAKRANILTFLEALDGQDGIIEEFNEELWYRSMDRVQVWPDKRLVFIFRDGSEYVVPALAWMD